MVCAARIQYPADHRPQVRVEVAGELVGGRVLIVAGTQRAISILKRRKESLHLIPLIAFSLKIWIRQFHRGTPGAPVNQDVWFLMSLGRFQGIVIFPVSARKVTSAIGLSEFCGQWRT